MTDRVEQGKPELLGVVLVASHLHEGEPVRLARTAGPGPRTMPGWLQAFASVQPVSVTVNVVRALSEGGPTLHRFWQSLAWTAGILLVFVPLAVRQYRRL